MSQPLQSFLQDLATEIETDCENLTVVVDNAHIPIHCSEEFADDTMNASEFAINTASFPATFLRETSRWDAMQGCSNSHFLLGIPPPHTTVAVSLLATALPMIERRIVEAFKKATTESGDVFIVLILRGT